MAPEDDGQPGYLMLLPYLATEGGTVTDVVAAISPWGSPTVCGLQGRNSAGVPWLGLTTEIPLGWVSTNQQVPKAQLELLHLQRLAVDCRCATGLELYDAVDLGDDPPDLVTTGPDGVVGWELTSFSIERRRQAQSLFFEVVARLASQQRHRMTHLAGYNITMWFGSADDPAGLPYQRNDQASYDALVESIVSHIPNPDQFRIDNGTLPPKLTGMGPVRGTRDVSFFTTPLLIGAPASGLFGMTGVSASLAFQSDHTSTAEWERLQAMVERKDRPGNHRLLVSVGAPNRNGKCFPSEEALADFMLANPQPIVATNLRSVVLHFWSTGRAFELIDGPTALWKGIYQGFSPSSHPFVASAQQP